MTDLWFGLSRASRKLIGVGGLILLVLTGAVCITVMQMREAKLSGTRQDLGKLGIAIAEQTSRSMQAASLVLQEMRKEVMASGPETAEDFRAAVQTVALHTFMAARANFLPQVGAFTIIGADGKLLNFSRQWPTPVTDLSDRDYYKFFKDNDVPSTFVSKPVQNRSNGGWTAYLVQRVNSRSGKFLGMVLAAMDLEYFQEFYKALTVGAGTTVTLLRRDGTVLTSFPTTARVGDMLSQSSPWHSVVMQGAGSITVEGVLAPGRRIVSIHALADYPLVVNVSVSQRDTLAPWRHAAILAVICTASAVLCVLLLLRALTLQLQRLERSEASLELKNRQMEGTRLEMQAQAEELSASQARLAEKSAALETTLGNISQGIMMVAADLGVEVCNQRAIEMLDLPPELMASRPGFDAVVAYQRSIDEFAVHDSNVPQTVGQAVIVREPSAYERKRPNGRIIEVQSLPLPSGGMVRTYTDITQRRISEEQIRYFAQHDDLTKLVNRVVFHRRLQHAIELADSSGRSVAVFYLDLDGFKPVNDTFGHGVGDQLLMQVSDRLRNAVRDVDTVARMGGDEFAIIQPLLDQQSSCERLAQRIIELLKEPFEVDGNQCRIGISIGIALYPEHAANTEDLLREADTALYRAKTTGKGRFCIFDKAADARHRQSCLMENDLAQAHSSGQFELEYQPIVDSTTLNTIRFEVLLRWRHPTRGLIAPEEFISLIEASGLIVQIGAWVLDCACREAAKWPEHIGLSVNLSPRQFVQDDLERRVLETLKSTGLAPGRLNLEVTEGMLLDDSHFVLNAMLNLEACGIKFSLDNFGKAHAGLSYLRRFPFDVIKIDKSFIQEALGKPEARAIIAAVMTIGTALDLAVVAEGVETEAQLALMRRLGCHQIQGSLTGSPQDAAAWPERIAPASDAAAPGRIGQVA